MNRWRAASLCIVFLSISVRGDLVLGQPSETEASASALPTYVFIIGVAEFDDDSISGLSSVQESSSRIREFLRSNFPAIPMNNYRIATLRHQTSQAQIRKLLFETIPALPRSSQILLFIMGHGFQSESGDGGQSSDLLIPAGDSSKENLVGTAIRGSEILEALSKAPDRSHVLAFLDTCNSGVLARRTLAYPASSQARVLGSKALLLAASGAEEKSYGTVFTDALLTVLEENNEDCLAAEAFAARLNDVVRSRSSDYPLAEAVIAFNGLCVNTVGAQFAALLIENYTSRPVRVKFESVAGENRDFYGEKNIGREDFKIIPIPRGKYSIWVGPRGTGFREPIDELELDFTNGTSWSYQVPGDVSERSPERTARLLESKSEMLEVAGFRVRSLLARRDAAGAYRLAGDSVAAERIESELSREPLPGFA